MDHIRVAGLPLHACVRACAFISSDIPLFFSIIPSTLYYLVWLLESKLIPFYKPDKKQKLIEQIEICRIRLDFFHANISRTDLHGFFCSANRRAVGLETQSRAGDKKRPYTSRILNKAFSP